MIRKEVFNELNKNDVFGAFPGSNLAIHSPAEDEGTIIAHCEAVHLGGMAPQEEDLLKLIAIPETNRPVLRTCEKAVRTLDEAQVGDGIFMAIQRTMCVAEVQAPYLNRLIGSSGGQDGVIKEVALPIPIKYP
jgi:hypothetical protein